MALPVTPLSALAESMSRLVRPIHGRPSSWSRMGVLDGADLDLDFTVLTQAQLAALGFIHTRADASPRATRINALGVVETVSADILRITHDPVTRGPLGYLCEPSSTNGIRNSTMVGAAAGTPGTLPTNWVEGLGGLSRQITATGIDAGIPFTDIRLYGTTTAAFATILFESSGIIPAAEGQIWTLSAYMVRVGGSTANIGNITLQPQFFTSGGGYISGPALPVTVNTGSLSQARKVFTAPAAPATTGFIRCQFAVTFAIGVAIDITIRVGAPQLEQQTFATSFIPTSTVGLNRQSDSLTDTLLATRSWFNGAAGTVVCEYMTGSGAGSIGFEVNDNTSNNRLFLGEVGNTPRLAGSAGGVALTNTIAGGGAAAPNTMRKMAASWDASGMSCCRDGLAVGTSASVPATAYTRAGIGASPNFGAHIAGVIRRLRYYRTRLSNAQLQALSA